MAQKFFVQNEMGQMVEVSPDQIPALASDQSGIGGSAGFGGLGNWNNNLVELQMRGNLKSKGVV